MAHATALPMAAFSEDLLPPNNKLKGQGFGKLFSSLRQAPLETMYAMQQHHGDFVRFEVPLISSYLVTHPDDVKTVLIDAAEHFSKRTRAFQFMREVFGEGLITSEGERWSYHRKLIQPGFHPKVMRSYADHMIASAEALCRQLDSHRLRGPLDVYPLFNRATLQVVARTLLGTGVDDEDDIARCIDDLILYTNHRSAELFPLPTWIPTRQNRKLMKTRKFFRDIVDSFISHELQVGCDRRYTTIVKLLLDEHQRQPEKFTRHDLHSQLITMFIAGHETTAIALTWCLYFLSRNPDVRQSLESEVGHVLSGSAITIQDLPKLKYTSMVVHEAMRLLPPVWAMTRRAESHVKLKHGSVKKGDRIVLSPFISHRHPDFWQKPHQFQPTRFENPAAIHPGCFFPFGGGQRVCIGQRFAVQEVVIMLATLVRRFRFRYCPSNRFKLEPSITLRPKFGLHLMPIART